MKARLEGLCPACGKPLLYVDAHGVIRCEFRLCANPSLLADFLSIPDQHLHYVTLTYDAWSVQHPLGCRSLGLTECDVYKAMTEFGEPPMPPGRYIATPTTDDGDDSFTWLDFKSVP